MQFSSAQLMWVSGIDPPGVCQLDLAQHRLDFLFARFAREAAVRDDNLSNLVADAHYRTQRKPGLLVDQRDLRASNSAQLSLGQPQQFLIAKQNRTLNPSVRRKQSEYG